MSSLPIRAALVLVLGLLALPGRAWPERLEVYHPRHRTAVELASLLSETLGLGGAFVPDRATNRLILRGEAGTVEEALETLRLLDVPLVAFRVESTLTTLSALRRAGVKIEGWVKAGEVRVATIETGPEGLRFRVRSLLSEGERRFQGVVTVLEGHPAEIWTGMTYPERVRGLEEEAGRLQVYETTTLVPVRTGFRAVPRALADGRVELEVAAISAEREPDGTIVRAGAATRVIVRPGELVVVASIRGEEGRLSIDPFATLDHREGTTDSALAVRVEPISPGP